MIVRRPNIILPKSVGITYLVVLVERIMGGGNCCVITELEFYDKNKTLLPYTVCADMGCAYDSARSGLPTYWNLGSIWGKENLNDGNLTYEHSCVLNHDSSSGWAQFVVIFNEKVDINSFAVWSVNTIGRLFTHFHICRPYNQEIKPVVNSLKATEDTDNYKIIHSSEYIKERPSVVTKWEYDFQA